MGFDLGKCKATIWDIGEETFSCSTRPWIAEAVLAVLEKPDETKNRTIFTSAFEISQMDILRELQELTQKKWTTTQVDSNTMIQQGKEQWAKGDWIGGGKLALAVAYSGKYGADFRKRGCLDNDLLGISPSKYRLADVIR